MISESSRGGGGMLVSHLTSASSSSSPHHSLSNSHTPHQHHPRSQLPQMQLPSESSGNVRDHGDEMRYQGLGQEDEQEDKLILMEDDDPPSPTLESFGISSLGMGLIQGNKIHTCLCVLFF